MSDREPEKVSATTATEVCSRFELGEEAKRLLRDDLTPRRYLSLLIEKKHYLDAVRLLAFALPKKEAVQWACLCARRARGTNSPGQVSAALQAAEKWVFEQNEDNRRAAMAAATEE